MNNKFSKPVLISEDTENSGYIESSSFNIFQLCTEENERIERYIQLKFNFSLNSKLLNKLLSEKLAKVILKITTDLHSKIVNVESLDRDLDEIIDPSSLQRVDKIECQAYIVASQKIDVDWTDEFNSSYERGEKYSFLPNEILAVSNLIKYSFKAEIGSLVNISEADDPNLKGLKFSTDQDNRLFVKVNHDLYEAINKLRSDSKKVRPKLLIDYYTIFSAVVYGITKIVITKDIENYRKKEWFKTLNHSFDEKDGTFEEFLNEMIENPDLDKIYSTAQELLSNKLEEKIIFTLKRG